MSTVHVCFQVGLLVYSVLIVFHWFFTWIALGDVDLRSSLLLVQKASAVQVETRWALWLYHKPNQLIHMTDGMTVTSFYASLQQKMSNYDSCVPHHVKPKIITYHLCQVTLNRTLSHYQKWCIFSSCIKVKFLKKKSRKKRPACVCTIFHSPPHLL